MSVSVDLGVIKCFVYYILITIWSTYLLDSLISRLEEYLGQNPVAGLVSHFLMLFRMLLPDLYSHFEDEDVDLQEWTCSWFSTLLAKELPIECVVRLWDTYFSLDDGFALHPFVCLSILSFLKDSLEELEQSEIRGTLNKLPVLDMDHVIGQAFGLQNDLDRAVAKSAP